MANSELRDTPLSEKEGWHLIWKDRFYLKNNVEEEMLLKYGMVQRKMKGPAKHLHGCAKWHNADRRAAGPYYTPATNGRQLKRSWGKNTQYTKNTVHRLVAQKPVSPARHRENKQSTNGNEDKSAWICRRWRSNKRARWYQAALKKEENSVITTSVE